MNSSHNDFALGIEGFFFSDLYRTPRLAELYEVFRLWLREADSECAVLYEEYMRRSGEEMPPLELSEALIRTGRRVDAFIGMLFAVENDQSKLKHAVEDQKPVFRFKRDFLQRRVWKKFKPEQVKQFDFRVIDGQIRSLFAAATSLPPVGGAPIPSLDLFSTDEELATAMLVEWFTAQETEIKRLREQPAPDQEKALIHRLGNLRKSARGQSGGNGAALPLRNLDEAAAFLAESLTCIEQWCFARAFDPGEAAAIRGWVSYRNPEPLDYMHLVHVLHPNPELQEEMTGPEATLRRRDGFALTDRRYSPRQILNEVEYCVFCHERDKDSCSKGLREKDGSVKRNPLGIKLNGCPLDEKISEMHLLKNEGLSVGALAMIIVDNPMCPGTGHRICNDCMKACIYQKQEPVNIPQIETGVLTEVLNMPFGYEIYSLLTRWNPLNARRPFALPYNGKNILVVGLGPAGYTLSHYLLNEGFGVVGIDGLKIEPLDVHMTGHGLEHPAPVREYSILEHDLDKRIMSGFGGVSEYGITVRWDKNFLDVIHLTLARRDKFRIYGGVRFGGTVTIEDAWDLGFDHIAIASGAGKPTIVDVKNNMSRGMRMASDFLMALQLTGAAKKDTLANLQVQLPALVIGGGLTAIDTATELMAYYPVQVEKIAQRFTTLSNSSGEAVVRQSYNAEEKILLDRFLAHAEAIGAERRRAAAASEAPDFVPLLRSWGGVKIAYRKEMIDSPAYRLNHEEIMKALEEGISFIECVSPVEARLDAYDAVAAVLFERQAKNEDGKWRATGEQIEIPARSVMIAAGTSPNTIIGRENPGLFTLDAWNQYFLQHSIDEDGLKEAPAGETGFFTSYHSGGKYISYYGDNHPVYAGNVVKAMASAREGYRRIVALFANDSAPRSPEDPALREADWQTLADRLDDCLLATVVELRRYTPTIVDVIVRARYAAEKFNPGQFYRLQNYESNAATVDGTKLTMEGLALTGAWVDKERGLLSMIVLEMGTSSRLCAALQPGQRVVVMGPTGAPTEIPKDENVLLAGGGLGNAVLFSIAKALTNNGCKVLYFAGYKLGEDLYKREEIENSTTQVVWSTDAGGAIAPSRRQDAHFRGNIVQAMKSYADGLLGEQLVPLQSVTRIIAIGSDRMMAAVKEARTGVLASRLGHHIGIGSINSPMQCMMKEICAQCLQRHIDPETGKESYVFSCFYQDQELDVVDWKNLNDRLRQNTVMEKLSNKYFDWLLLKEDVNMI